MIADISVMKTACKSTITGVTTHHIPGIFNHLADATPQILYITAAFTSDEPH